MDPIVSNYFSASILVYTSSNVTAYGFRYLVRNKSVLVSSHLLDSDTMKNQCCPEEVQIKSRNVVDQFFSARF